MRRQLIEALSYPRLLVQKIMEENDCPYDGLFEATSERCHNCDLNSECHWVAYLSNFSGLEDKAIHTLNASLRYGIRLVENVHSELRHDETLCKCEACAWIRDAQRLTEEFEAHLAPNPYRPVH